MTSHVLAVDIGSTKVDVCRIGPSFSVIEAEEIPTASLGPGSLAFVDGLKRTLRDWLTDETTGIAVSFNCSMRDGVVAWSSVLGGPVGYPIEEDLSAEFGMVVAADDDIHAMTLAEAHLGAGVGIGSFAMLNIGTGIGVGCFEGRVLRGAGNAGLIGHNPTFVPELGETRHLDRVVSGRGVSEVYALFGGPKLAARDVFSRAGVDPQADRAIAVFTRHFADVLVDISQFYDPDAIVVNGSIRHAAPLYLDAAWRRYVSLVEPALQVRSVVISSLEHAAPLGAALWLRGKEMGTTAFRTPISA